jgi:hypothetical protein
LVASSTQVLNQDADVAFYFGDRGLSGVVVLFPQARDQHDAFEEVKAGVSEKLGRPSESETKWAAGRDDHNEEWDQAVLSGDVTLRAEWRTPETAVSVRCPASPGNPRVKLQYQAKSPAGAASARVDGGQP